MTLESLFATVLQLSFYGTVGCGVILVCALVNYARAPRWISMVLWGLVALRLVIPFHFSSAVSLFQIRDIANLTAQIDRTLVSGEAYSGDYQTALEGSAEFEQAVAAGSPVSANADGGKIAYYYARENGSIEPAKTTYASLLFIGSRIWLAGVTLLWLWAAFSYARLQYKLRFSMLLCRGVYETDAVSSPCVVGIIRPRIYLVPGLTDQQKMHILLHERMHIRCLDHIWKVVSFLVISIHWFNPFLWFMYRLFQGELEKACDERVLARLGEDKKEDYSQSLLALAAGKDWKSKHQKRKLPTPIAFGEDNIKGRIKRILAYRKPLITVSVLVVIISIAGCCVFLTMPERTAADTLENVQTPDTAPDTDNALLSDNDATIPESQPDESFPADSNTISTEAIPNEGTEPDLTEVYAEISDNGVTYQARWGGIYRINADGSETQIYNIFAGVHPQLTIFEERLYFLTDRFYTDGALDWSDNTIRWIDLQTLAVGDLPMVQTNASISTFGIYDGIVKVYYTSDDVDTQMLYASEDIAFHGKSIAQLTETEQQQFGLEMTQSILQNPGTLVNISNRARNQNIAYLDMDGDLTAEQIVLEPSKDPANALYIREDEPLTYYHLQIGGAEIEAFGENLANILWAVSLDGREILLVLYEDGPSADPYTHFYRYRNGRILEIGGFEDDIRLCGISSDGIITSGIRKELVQTDWITVRWQIDQNGMLAEIPQEVYDFRNGNWVELYDELPLHPAVGDSDTFTIAPQMVRFLQTSADWNWILLETEDGQQGWVHMENFEIVELKKNVMDVFDGLYLAG
ncbi:MAG: M56 family metallopeptidase [Lachnospiraceae bacterium]|nr:M56 family metallopeptidase [Lachnospiraceae bacterium]